jgi:glycosyltransferase involved in cell wall biosynthesis
MQNGHRTLVIIPARNEATRIPAVIRGIRENLPGCDILVVEDGSTDDTVGVVRSMGAKIVTLPINLGYGGAIRVGFQYASSKGYHQAITMDADGQHDPSDLPTIMDGLVEDGNDLVIGSRFLGQATYSIPPTRRIGMFLFSVITSAVVGTKITDTTCGFMGVGRQALPVAAEFCATDFPNAELICIVSTKGLKVGEVPIRIHDRDGGKSMFTFWKALYYPFKLLLAISMVVLRK